MIQIPQRKRFPVTDYPISLSNISFFEGAPVLLIYQNYVRHRYRGDSNVDGEFFSRLYLWASAKVRPWMLACDCVLVGPTTSPPIDPLPY